jgi:hypothetical protein
MRSDNPIYHPFIVGADVHLMRHGFNALVNRGEISLDPGSPVSTVQGRVRLLTNNAVKEGKVRDVSSMSKDARAKRTASSTYRQHLNRLAIYQAATPQEARAISQRSQEPNCRLTQQCVDQ